MMSFHSQADACLARKYGADAWEWMPNWGKVCNRLEERIYQRHNRRMLLVASIVPAVTVSVLVQLIAWCFRN